MPLSESSYNQAVISYYDKAEVSYRDIWDLDRSMAMHYGYWDQTIKNFPHSLLKMNQVLAEKLQPVSKERILDAGCGVGGSSIFMAKNFACHVTGISLSEKQVRSARKNAEKNKVQDLCNFIVADYLNTGFENNTFDGIWALESVCHATNKNLFLNEAYRILKPGGRLILSDGFKKPDLNSEENQLLQNWLSGWSITDLETIDRMKFFAAEQGFKNISIKNISENILPTALRMYRFGLMAKFYGKLTSLFGKKYGNPYTLNNTRSAIFQYISLKRKLWSYHLFYAEKSGEAKI